MSAYVKAKPRQLSGGQKQRVAIAGILAMEPSVIIARRPCALLIKKKTAPCFIDKDACKKCGMCMKIGCPAISFRDGKASIDPTQCVGCGVCQQLCAFDAFQIKE